MPPGWWRLRVEGLQTRDGRLSQGQKSDPFLHFSELRTFLRNFFTVKNDYFWSV